MPVARPRARKMLIAPIGIEYRKCFHLLLSVNQLIFLKLAQPQGFEPQLIVLETIVLPLHQGCFAGREGFEPPFLVP